ncbi:hypothetical protein [Pseudomonas mangrovi]|uniref:Lipoprotein n=1 Tax=Pseudomonas mangrovi TaxID=2161748 RepID=A0A2T5P6W7_9PSED|nr:hypothetical protein [Pseudomonas mangrovi]PTU73492.1 hypothetical protein DBO85_14285 [Pseudomonas mangrovi]
MHLIKSLLVVTAVALSGCTTAPTLPPPTFPGIEQSNKIAIEDLRPASESEKKIFSLMVSSDAYAIYRVADNATDPTGPRLLAHRAYEAFPQLAEQPSIKVLHFVTYANMQSHLRRSVTQGLLIGPVGMALVGSPSYPSSEVLTSAINSEQLERTAGDQEHTRAYFTEQENPSKSPVNVIYIDAEILGKRVASRCLVPPVTGKPNLFLVEAFDMCIANHLALHRSINPATAPQ